MLTTILTDDQDICPIDARFPVGKYVSPERSRRRDDELWKEYSDRVIGICETMRIHDRHRRSMGNTGKALISTPGQFQGLDKIVKINRDTRTALVEANVTMERLVEATQRLHLIPTVVAESRSMSVADAFAATTNESSSSRFGTFDCTVMAAGVVLGNGQFEITSIGDVDNSSLLEGSAGAFHSLGITTMLEITLMKAGPYVEVTYTPVSSVSKMTKEISITATNCAKLESSIDFVEGILLDRCSGMVITGRQIPIAHHAVSQVLSRGEDFTEHVQSVWHRSQQTGKPHVELLPIAQYLFRHNNRRVVHKARKKRFSFSAKASAMKFLDFAISESTAQEVMESLIAVYDNWPIWICPIMPPKRFGRRLNFGLEPAADKLFLNIGFWGSTDAWNGSMDVDLRQRAFRYLHSRAPCSPDTVWFDHNDRRYGWLRTLWKAEAIADVGERLSTPNPICGV